MPTFSTAVAPGSNIDQNLAKPRVVGKAPKLRLSRPEDAYQIAATLVRAAIPRVERGRMVQGLLDGNPPRSPAALRRAAQDWRANFNTLEGSAMVANAKTPYYDLLNASMPLVEVDLDSDEVLRDSWNLVAAEEFHRFLYSYPSFESVFWTMLEDFVVFNKGFFWWPDPLDPWFKRLEWWRVMFPNGTGIDPSEWNQFAIRQYFTVTKLWELSGGGEAPHWNGRAVLGAISRAQALLPQSQQAEGMELQQALRDCDVLLSARSEVVRAVSIFTREYDGKWTWHMVEEDAAMQVVERSEAGMAPDPADDRPRFLFSAPRLFESPAEILASFVFEAGSGSINAFSGLGRQLFDLLRSKDIIQMGLLDGAILRQYPMIQAQDGGSAQKAAMLRLGPLHVLSPGVNVIQTNLMADLEGSLAVMQHLDQQVESNTAIFKPRIEKPRGNPETATSAQLRFQNATILGSSAVNRFYSQGDRWIEEVWKRATADLPESSRPGIKAAREFQECCKERGVPLSVLRKPPYSVKLARAIGNGSPMARQQAIGAMTPLVPEMGPRGRRAYFQMYTSAYLGARSVERLWPQDDVLGLPDSNTWMAEQENNSMANSGGEPTITDGQDSRVHAQSHLSAVQAGLQSLQQGADPMLVLNFVPVALTHAGKHVATLPKDEQKNYIAVMTQLGKLYQEMLSQFQQQQAQGQKRAAQAQASMSEQQLKLLEIQLDAQRKDAKNQAQMGQRAERHMQDQALADAKAAAEIERSTASTTTEIERSSAQVATDIAAKAASTQADIQAQAAKTAAEIEATRAKTAAAVEASKAKAKAAASKPKGGGSK